MMSNRTYKAELPCGSSIEAYRYPRSGQWSISTEGDHVSQVDIADIDAIKAFLDALYARTPLSLRRRNAES